MSDITALLPTSGAILRDTEFATQPSYTYAMHISAQSIYGMTDEQEAMRQAIYKIIRTERYTYPVYSWDYGIELADLFGKPTPYVEVELKRRIREALEWDDRINKVDSFKFSYPEDKNTVHVQFAAHTIFGDVEIEHTYSLFESAAEDDSPFWYVDGKTVTATWKASAVVSGHTLILR